MAAPHDYRVRGAAASPDASPLPPAARAAVTVEPLVRDDLDAAVGVAVRAMHDNPVTLAAFGHDEASRRRVFGALTQAVASTWAEHAVVARTSNGAVVGVCGVARPGGGQPRPSDAARVLTALLSAGPGAWAAHDPKPPHWHVGPVAVEPAWQGTGMGLRMLEALRARMGGAGDAVHPETDRPINVPFYERFGFAVLAEQPVLGVPNRFTLRPARSQRDER